MSQISTQSSGGGGSGTVTDVSVVTANGVSGSVANSTTTPAITLTLGDITPSSVTATGEVNGLNLSGINSGDQFVFNTVAVSGQFDIVSGATNGTLTFVAGTNITLTTDPDTDSLTISASGGSGTFSMTETEIDFGTTPVWDKTFTVTDGTVTGSSKISVWPSGNVATGRVGNDLEWDNLLLGALAGSGEFTLTALAFPGPVVGKRKVYYAIA